MTDADLAEIKEDTEKLEQFQTKADTPEILAQIPLLEISEIDKKPQLVPYNTDTAAKFLHVPLESNGILYLKLMFDISAVPQELLPYTGASDRTSWQAGYGKIFLSDTGNREKPDFR